MEKKRIIGVYDYAVVPIASMVILNFLVYFGSRLIADGRSHYDLSGWADYQIPFIPIFIIPYLLAYVQWIIGYLVIARYERVYCRKIITGEMIAKIIILFIYIFFPTTMLRADVFGNDVFSQLVDLLYKYDAPNNLFPSIHCLESYICLKSALEMKDINNRYRTAMVTTSIIVFMSTVFIKQHVILDFFGAVIVAEVGRFLAERFYELNEYNKSNQEVREISKLS